MKSESAGALFVMAPMKVSVKHAGSTFDLELSAGDCPYRRLATRLNVPFDKIKLIRAGKLLPPAGSASLLVALAEEPGTILVSATRAAEHLPGPAGRSMSYLRELWASLTLLTLRETALAIALSVWGWLATGGRMAISFVSSAVVAPPPSRHQHNE